MNGYGYILRRDDICGGEIIRFFENKKLLDDYIEACEDRGEFMLCTTVVEVALVNKEYLYNHPKHELYQFVFSVENNTLALPEHKNELASLFPISHNGIDYCGPISVSYTEEEELVSRFGKTDNIYFRYNGHLLDTDDIWIFVRAKDERSSLIKALDLVKTEEFINFIETDDPSEKLNGFISQRLH